MGGEPATARIRTRDPAGPMSPGRRKARPSTRPKEPANVPAQCQWEDGHMRKFLLATLSAAAIVVGAASLAAPARAEWDIAKAAAPYKGTQLNVIFLDRPGYRAIIKLLPDFEKKTGIKVNYDIVPYENTREREVLNFNSHGDLTIALVDLVWIGEYAENGWIQTDRQIRQRCVDHRSEPQSQGLLSAAAECFRQLGRHHLWVALRQLFGPAFLQFLHAQERRPSPNRRRPGTNSPTPMRRS